MEPLLGLSPCLWAQGEVPWTHLKSLPLKKSQAEAWHTTSRPSVGFSSIDLFQKSGGTGSSPKEMKKLFASSNILLGVQPCKSRELCPNWEQTVCPRGGECWERARPKELARRAFPPLCPGPHWKSKSVQREDRCRPALSWPPWHPSWGLKGREPPSHRYWTRFVPTCSLETGRG